MNERRSVHCDSTDKLTIFLSLLKSFERGLLSNISFQLNLTQSHQCSITLNHDGRYQQGESLAKERKGNPCCIKARK